MESTYWASIRGPRSISLVEIDETLHRPDPGLKTSPTVAGGHWLIVGGGDTALSRAGCS